MALLSILHYPNPNLQKKAAQVKNIDSDLDRFIDMMFKTMYESRGIGLAATQVDVHEQIIVIDLDKDRKSPLVLINPHITSEEDITDSPEGCLSVPFVYETVKRVAQIHAKALDRNGKPIEMDAEGLLSCCIQHEIDHLNGILFIDHLSPLKRDRALAKAKKLRKRTL